MQHLQDQPLNELPSAVGRYAGSQAYNRSAPGREAAAENMEGFNELPGGDFAHGGYAHGGHYAHGGYPHHYADGGHYNHGGYANGGYAMGGHPMPSLREMVELMPPHMMPH